MWRNEWEIEEIATDCGRSADKRIVAYGLVLVGWVNIVNSHSDGWPYWLAGSKAAEKLSDLLARVTGRAYATKPGPDGRPVSVWGESRFGDEPYVPTDAELRATLTPMKTLATKRGLPSPLAVLEQPAPVNNRDAVRDALMVIVEDPAISQWLAHFDPKALAQARAALDQTKGG